MFINKSKTKLEVNSPYKEDSTIDLNETDVSFEALEKITYDEYEELKKSISSYNFSTGKILSTEKLDSYFVNKIKDIEAGLYSSKAFENLARFEDFFVRKREEIEAEIKYAEKNPALDDPVDMVKSDIQSNRESFNRIINAYQEVLKMYQKSSIGVEGFNSYILSSMRIGTAANGNISLLCQDSEDSEERTLTDKEVHDIIDNIIQATRDVMKQSSETIDERRQSFIDLIRTTQSLSTEITARASTGRSINLDTITKGIDKVNTDFKDDYVANISGKNRDEQVKFLSDQVHKERADNAINKASFDKKVNIITSENKDLQEDNAKKQEQINKLSARIHNADMALKNNDNLVSQNNQLKQECDEKEKELNEIKEQTDQLNAQKESIVKQVADYNDKASNSKIIKGITIGAQVAGTVGSGALVTDAVFNKASPENNPFNNENREIIMIIITTVTLISIAVAAVLTLINKANKIKLKNIKNDEVDENLNSQDKKGEIEV